MPVSLAWPPPPVSAAPQRAEIRLGGDLVGDVDVRVCDVCRRAALEHIRVDAAHRRRGVTREALALVVAWPGYSSSTTVLEPEAEAFWRRVFWPTPELLGTPQWCEHMAEAESALGCE
ncbi:hypothetical protein LCD36_04695 [Saccharopolyspora sp. 6T]|uniref:GNAT family N-acetyltransferase n=1 Tax=Saccharopolyspora sp. 6T TaxID=2877238 RepID=UPI001CD4E662|nr:hypothetical protein [Saccharopolyspora sp. 6T]MCA1185751.1 hypothetical protein [Saccharopolyspora sp. 6T]